MTSDTFLGSPLIHGQDIYGTLRKNQRLCVHLWFDPGPCMENQGHTNKTLGFLLADNSILLLNTGMEGQRGHWLNPALSSATPCKNTQRKLLSRLAEKAGSSFCCLLGYSPALFRGAVVVLCINPVRIHPLLQDLHCKWFI